MKLFIHIVKDQARVTDMKQTYTNMFAAENVQFTHTATSIFIPSIDREIRILARTNPDKLRGHKMTSIIVDDLDTDLLTNLIADRHALIDVNEDGSLR